MATRNHAARDAVKAISGLLAVVTLLAHFWLPELPLTWQRIYLLLLLIGALLGVDMLSNYVNVERQGAGISLSLGDKSNGHGHHDERHGSEPRGEHHDHRGDGGSDE